MHSWRCWEPDRERGGDTEKTKERQGQRELFAWAILRELPMPQGLLGVKPRMSLLSWQQCGESSWPQALCLLIKFRFVCLQGWAVVLILPHRWRHRVVCTVVLACSLTINAFDLFNFNWEEWRHQRGLPIQRLPAMVGWWVGELLHTERCEVYCWNI